MDEATSSVDTETELRIQAAIERMVHGRTVVVIAHRLSTLRMAARLYVLAGGRIVESGPHARLMRSGVLSTSGGAPAGGAARDRSRRMNSGNPPTGLARSPAGRADRFGAGELVRAIRTGGLLPPFPFSAPDDLVRCAELGLLAPLETFSAGERQLIESELQRRYFAPRITAITALEERFGQSHWKVETEAGATEFTVQNEHANLRDLPAGRCCCSTCTATATGWTARLPPRIRRRLEAMF